VAKTAVVIAHGDLEVTREVQEAVGAADLIIAADGGAAAAVAQGWWPHLIVGDLDSAPPEVRTAATQHGAETLQYSPHKNETDTELAVQAALERGAEEICLLGVTGKRVDHTLANILLLARPELAAARVTILAGRQRIFAIRTRTDIRGLPGDLVSLLPIGGDAEGIRTTGLEYPLQGETLPFGIPRGISNVLTEPVATVQLERGVLLAIVTPAE
jgi:thiamine pyrophosphokinase